MIMTFLHFFCLSTLFVWNTYGETRYFIEASTNNIIARARPLDICHQDSTGKFTIYSCNTTNPSNHILVAEQHDRHYPFCNSFDPIIRHYFNNQTTDDITEGSFNCVGEDNYAIIHQFTNETLCTNYIDANKQNESNNNSNEVSVIYRATNVCYHYHNMTSTSAADIEEVLLMNYCNAFYVSYRLFEDDANCMSDLKYSLPETVNSVGRVSSPNVCSTDQSGDRNHSSIVMHQCVVNGVIMSPYDYDYDSGSLTQITISERIGLIDWLVATSDMHNDTFYPWAEYHCNIQQIGGWNLIDITENGNIYQLDGETPICGILLRDPGDIFTETVYGFIDVMDGLLEYDYVDPFIRTNVNPLNKTIVYGLDFYYENIEFAGSIPNTICNLHNLHFLHINAAKAMYGTIPECIGNDLDVHRLQLINLDNITGIIPESLCNIQNFHMFQIINLQNLSGTIPDCLGDEDMNYRSLMFWRNRKITGTLPENMFCGYHLMSINFHNNSSMEPQTLPLCWSDSRPFLMFVIMPYANLYGTMPKMPQVDYTTFAWLELQGNALKGSVTDIFGDMQKGELPDFYEEIGELMGTSLNFKFLQVFMIHDNLFHDEDITSFLTQIFSENDKGITVFSMSNNSYITGQLPDINVTIKPAGINRQWTALLLHDLDLYGTIPERMQLGDIDYLTLHNNRLSGYLPTNFKTNKRNPNISNLLFNKANQSETTSAVVLLGNMFWTRFSQQSAPPKWVDSKLRTAVNIYYTPLQRIESIVVVVCGFIGIICGMLYWFQAEAFEKKCFHHKQELFEKNLPIILFFDTLQTLRKLVAMNNTLLFWFVFILSIFYALTSKYYTMIPYESQFALPWYWINPVALGQNMVYLMDTCLIIFALIFNWLLYRLVRDLNTLNKQTQKEIQANKHGYRSSLKLKMIELQTAAATNTIINDKTQMQRELPNGWRKAFTNDERLYFINDVTKETQWNKPEALPLGWNVRYTEDGRIFYQNNKSKRTQWQRPQLLTSLPKEWQEMYTMDGRIYYANHVTKQTQWELPTMEQQHEINDAHHVQCEKSNEDDDDGIASEIEAEPKCKSFFKMILFFLIWLVYLVAVIAYILSSSLPDENIFGFPSVYIIILSKIMPLLLVLNDKYVIPAFASGVSGTFADGTKGKYSMILILQLTNDIILPFFGSLILLNECGRYWVNLWKLCVDEELRSQYFDIILDNGDLSTTTLLTSTDVCGSVSLFGGMSFVDINFNKCLRSFLHHWTSVMMSKLVIGVLLEYVMFWYRKLKEKRAKKANAQNYNKIVIHIDGQYMNITVDLLVSVAFSFCAPMIIAINVLEIMVKSILYKTMRYEYGWIFDIKHAADDQTLPVNFLWIGVIFNQLFTLLFCGLCIKSSIAFGVLAIIGIFGMDIYIIWTRRKTKSYANADADENEIQAFWKQVTVFQYEDYWKCDVCTMINENKEANCVMCNNPHEKIQCLDQEKEILPDGWSVAYADDDKKYYKNNITKTTQWVKPTHAAADYIEREDISDAKSEDEKLELADETNKGNLRDEIEINMQEGNESDNDVVHEWTVKDTQDGKKYYENEETEQITYDKPDGFVMTNNEGMKFIGDQDETVDLPIGWRQMYTEDGKRYYQNDITKVTSWEIPKKMSDVDRKELYLPDGWRKEYTKDKKVYYLNDATKVTQWEHPIEKNKGWIKRERNNGKVYYQNEFTKETQWEKPNAFYID